MNETTSTLRSGLESAWVLISTAIPKFLLFLVILVVGYYVAKLLCKGTNHLLERVRFDRLVERGGVKQALQRAGWDASDIMARIVFWAVMLLAAQLAFGIFGPNPISELITRVIAFLPTLLVASLIIVVAAAIAAGVREVVGAALSGLSYGQWVARAAAAAILILGVFAALSHLRIAPAIVNGLFYAVLAVLVGSAIVAIGGGGIVPMRSLWERSITKVQGETPRLREKTHGAGERAATRAEEVKREPGEQYRHAA